MVMYLGKVVEIGPVDRRSTASRSTPTRRRCSPRCRRWTRTAAPNEAPLSGDPPNPINPPSGCRFRTRCPVCRAGVCRSRRRRSPMDDGGRAVACHMADRPAPGHPRLRAEARMNLPVRSSGRKPARPFHDAGRGRARGQRRQISILSAGAILAHPRQVRFGQKRHLARTDAVSCRRAAAMSSGRIGVAGHEITSMSEGELREVRGSRDRDDLSGADDSRSTRSITIGEQIAETIVSGTRASRMTPRGAARLELFEMRAASRPRRGASRITRTRCRAACGSAR